MQVLELLLVTPIFVAVLVAAIEYVPLFAVKSTIVHATTVGAREAGKLATTAEVAASINKFLSEVRIQIGETDTGKLIAIRDATSGTRTWGDTSLLGQVPPAPIDSTEVQVTVCILFSATKTDGNPVLQPFNAFGYALYGSGFCVTTEVTKE